MEHIKFSRLFIARLHFCSNICAINHPQFRPSDLFWLHQWHGANNLRTRGFIHAKWDELKRIECLPYIVIRFVGFKIICWCRSQRKRKRLFLHFHQSESCQFASYESIAKILATTTQNSVFLCENSSKWNLNASHTHILNQAKAKQKYAFLVLPFFGPEFYIMHNK